MRILSILILLVVLLLALSYWLPIEGAWLDPFLSAYFSRKFGINVSVHHARIERWRRTHFDSADISAAPDSPKLHSGPGLMELKAFPFRTQGREETVVVMENLTVPADFYKKAALSLLTKMDLSEQALTVDRLRLSISRAEAGIGYHLVECVSKDFRLQGGVTVNKSKIHRIHLLLLLHNPLLERFPALFRSRLIRRPDDWQGLRVLYHPHTLTAIGGKGPFFKADWS
ncbi:MAG: hypothetical protein A3C47_01410 [Omnitrophica bacterium RIFCSPHIGHO2_02_FULL_51_18]|nr:MAG: hypothetical protein A3C47_01410 [Omnitrophica bacterium RIFCSPHIGHO2_02_FULL_51_18]